jgi:hypothetical protein
MSRPSWREFRRHRAVEQGCSLPPPAPQASIVLLPVRKLQIWPRNPLAKLREKIPLEPRAKTESRERRLRMALLWVRRHGGSLALVPRG